jgi:hypothetical protein
MKLLNFDKAKGSDVFAHADDFGALWDEAEQYGEVSVGPKMFQDGAYEACVKFTRKSGSYVWARAVSKDRHQALRMAIAEAVELGAQPTT